MSLPQTSSAPVVSNPPPHTRGAQTNNNNAWQHGAYSRLNPSRLSQLIGYLQIISHTLRQSQPPSPPAQEHPSQDVTLSALRELNSEFFSVFDDALKKKTRTSPEPNPGTLDLVPATQDPR